MKQNEQKMRIAALRWLIPVLAVALVILPWGSALAAAWDGTAVDTSWYNAGASEYHLSTPAQLAGLAELVNSASSPATFQGKTIVLDADIDLGNHDWTPIGITGNSFEGTFDGNGHTISNVSISKYWTDTSNQTYSSFFIKLNGATIKNLTLAGKISCGRTVYFVGGFCSEAASASFENCVNQMTFGDTTIYYAGGFASYTQNAAFTGCTNEADVVVGVSLGAAGFVGYAEDPDQLSFSSCVNNGNIASYYYTAGGFVAESQSNGIDLSSCVNNGDVTLRLTYSSQSGGLIGYNKKGNVSISLCQNSGTITGSDAGGLVGRNTEELNGFAHMEIRDSLNRGAINVNRAYGQLYPNIGGGIIGWCLNTSIDHCINVGNINAASNSYSSCGGIAGTSYSAEIVNCANYGNITGYALWAGGIAGANYYMQQSIRLDRTGGTASILNCYNSGDVHAQYSAGGIVGALGMSSDEDRAVIDNSYSCGVVSADSDTNVAGIAGKLFFGTITNSYYLKTGANFPSYSYGTDGVATTDIFSNVGYIEVQGRSDPDVYLTDFTFLEYDDGGSRVASPASTGTPILTALQNVMKQHDGFYMPWVIAQDHNHFYPVFGQPVTFVVKPSGTEGYEQLTFDIAPYNQEDYGLAAHTFYFADTDVIDFDAIENEGFTFTEAKVTKGEPFISAWDAQALSFTMGAFPVEIELWYTPYVEPTSEPAEPTATESASMPAYPVVAVPEPAYPVPKTGDEQPVERWYALIGAGAVSLAAAVWLLRRKNRH